MSSRDRPARRWGGAALIGSVSAGCAMIGWLTLIVVARVDPERYAPFAVLWAFYYFSAGALSGLQQEVTRVSVAGDRRVLTQGTSLRFLGLVIGLGFAVVVAGTYAWWGRAVEASWVLVLPMSLGVISLAFLTVTLGVLAAESRWSAAAALLVGDALLRLGLVSIAGATTDSTFWYGVAIVCGNVTWLPVLWSARSASTRNTFREHWEFSALLGRSLTSIASTASASLLIAGLPWLLAVTKPEDEGALSGSLLAALVLFRSPVLVLIQGLRPVILRGMLEEAHDLVRHVWQSVAIYSAVAVIATFGAYAAGPWLLTMTFGDSFVVRPVHAAILVFSAVLLALATHLNLAFIAADRHRKGTEGWLVALAATVVVLLLPIGQPERLMWAALTGPAAGIVSMVRAWAGVRTGAAHR